MVYFCSAQMMLKKFTLRDLFSSDLHELSTKLPWMPMKVLKVHIVSDYVLFSFLCPRYEMAEGLIEFTLSVCVCVSVFQNRVPAIT